VPGIYGVGELKYEELEDALKWLLEEARFIHAGIEVKVSVSSIESFADFIEPRNHSTEFHP
jgi:hypothetical protein